MKRLKEILRDNFPWFLVAVLGGVLFGHLIKWDLEAKAERAEERRRSWEELERKSKALRDGVDELCRKIERNGILIDELKCRVKESNREIIDSSPSMSKMLGLEGDK